MGDNIMIDKNTYFTKRKSIKLDNRFPKVKHTKKDDIIKINEKSIFNIEDKKVTGLVSVKVYPTEVLVGEIIKPSSILINANYSDGTTNKVPATMVICDTSVKGKVTGRAYYNEFGPVTFTVLVK